MDIKSVVRACEMAEKTDALEQKVDYLKQAQRELGAIIFKLDSPAQICEVCGRPFYARTDAKTCGDTCKKRKYRANQRKALH
jgi:hypothetical protein